MGAALCPSLSSHNLPQRNRLQTGAVCSLGDFACEEGVRSVVSNPCTGNELIFITQSYTMKRYCLKSHKLLECGGTINNGKIFEYVKEEYIRQKSRNGNELQGVDVNTIRPCFMEHQLKQRNNHQIIFLGKFEHGANSQSLCDFYSIIDVSKWKFVHISFDDRIDPRYGCLNDYLLPINHNTSNGGLLFFENWMIFLKGTCICIYKIDNDTFNMGLVREESIDSYIYDKQGRRYQFFFAAIADVSAPLKLFDAKTFERMRKKANKNNGDNKGTKCILLFGNFGDRAYSTDIITFVDSFTLLIATFDDNALEISKACESDVNQLFGFNLEINKEFVDFFRKCRMSSFGHFLIDERYLVLIGGFLYAKDRLIKNSGKSVIVFDFKRRVWSLLDIALPMAIAGNLNTTFICMKEKGDRQLATMSFKMMEKAYIYIISHGIDEAASSLKLYLARALPWKSERLLWIGHLSSNENNDAICYLSMIPKDIIILYFTVLRQYS